MNIELIGSALLISGLCYWSAAKSNQEFAYAAVKNRCQHLGLQMLDDYVALQKIQLRRNQQGRLSFIRTYGFEFSSTGNERYDGQIVLSGREIQAFVMEAYRVVHEFNP